MIVPLVTYENGVRQVIGEADVSPDGKVNAQITAEGVELSEVLKAGMVFGVSLGPFRHIPKEN